ncbi:MAG: succinate dehydrogenase assembly factor 2 [Mariprofundaceae bacterium]
MTVMALSLDVRRLRYRLQRQGMLELDAWLSGLDAALLSNDLALIHDVNELLLCESPVLLAMMQGEIPIPDRLKVYLESF